MAHESSTDIYKQWRVYVLGGACNTYITAVAQSRPMILRVSFRKMGKGGGGIIPTEKMGGGQRKCT